jgi:hypothetical protein
MRGKAVTDSSSPEEPKRVPGGALIRGAINSFGGLIPVVGSVLSAAAGAWSEQEQEKFNQFIKQWIKMLEDEARESANRSGDYEPIGHARRRDSQRAPSTMKSAFDDEEAYELTELGDQFVHNAMSDLPPKISFDASAAAEAATSEVAS